MQYNIEGMINCLTEARKQNNITGEEILDQSIRWSDRKVFLNWDTGVYNVKNAIVTTGFSVINIDDKELYIDTTYDYIDLILPLRYKLNPPYFTYSNDVCKLAISGPVILIGGSPERSWFHWNLSWAPRLSILALARPDLLCDQNIPIIFHSHVLNEPFRDILKLYGLRPDRCVFADNEKDFECNDVYIPSFVSQFVYIKSALRDYVHRCICFWQKKRGIRRRGLRTFISRQELNSPNRKIANYENLLEIFQKYNIEPVVMEGKSLAEQIEVMQSSSIIIGSHGAGLVNMLFANPGTNIMILDKEQNIKESHTNMFIVLGEMFNLHVTTMTCEEKTPTDMQCSCESSHRFDFFVDEVRFEAILKRLIFLST